MDADLATGNRNGLAIITKYAKIPPSRISYHHNAGTEMLEHIERGLLFVMAFWSGASFQSLITITELLAELDPDARLEFVNIDTDGATELYDHPSFKNRLHGCGEIAWIRNSNIIATTNIGFDPKNYRKNMQELLSLA